MSDSPIYSAARDYIAASLSVIPIDANASKKPLYNLLPVVGQWPDGSPRRGWKTFMSRLASDEELNTMFNGFAYTGGIAVVCGNVSGGLEAIDIDSSEYVNPWLEEVQRRAPGLLDRLVMVRTPRPGLHIYYRCSEIGRNLKLAQRTIIDQVTLLSEIQTIIETRGEGGYALIPPTPGHCHPTGRLYEYCTPRTLLDVQEISIQERALLFEVAQHFNEVPRHVTPPTRQAAVPRLLDPRKPDDDFNAKADWNELLLRHGWSLLQRDSDGKEHWTRPGKLEGTSATLNYEGNGLFHVFTSNAEPLESNRSYTKFHFLVTMEYQGDFSRAKQVLRSRGYGQTSLVRNKPPRQGRGRSGRVFRGGRGRQ